ncbi:MAG: phytoene desaturase [Firmicutes bacterium]|nr:phytoene desaturase [Bacillota bacterium]
MANTVLIIGAGIGGLATAVRLLSKGYNVKIFEKESKVGGKTNQIVHAPFTFDLTASILMNRDIYEEVFHDAGLNPQEYLEFSRIEPTYRCFFPDGDRLDISRDIAELTKTLESIAQQDAVGYLKLFAEVYQRYVIANEHFLRKTFEKPIDFIKPSTVANALKTKSLSTSAKLIAKYIKDPKLRKFLAYQALYVGISPFEGPGTYTFVPVIAQLYGLWHLRGGFYTYIRALEKAIDHLGGEIIPKSAVDEILISDYRAVGIKVHGETVHGDIIISNADFPYTVSSLIKNKAHQGEHTADKLKSMQYTCSAFILYLGLKKQYPELSVHNLYLNENFKENIEQAFRGQIPTEPSFYIYCPSRIDNTMATEGECLSAVVRVPNLTANNITWGQDTISTIRNRILSALKSIPGLADIEDNISFESQLTPKDLKQRFNSYAGAAFGLSPTLTQTNYFRPHLQSDAVNNLYFTGQSVHPGPGASLVLLSSKLVVEKILAKR